MWLSTYCSQWRTSMMSALTPRSRVRLSSSTLMKLTGDSGGAAGAALATRRPTAATTMSAPRTLAADHPRARSHRRASVAELLGLHRLPLAAVRDRVETEVRADGVDVHEVVPRVGGDAAVAVELAELAVLDLVDAARGDAEVLSALGDRRRTVARHVVAVVDLLHDVLRRARAHVEDRVRHANQRDQRGVGGLPVAVGLAAEDRRGLPAVHEAAKDAAVDVHDAAARRALVIVLVVTEPRQRRIRVGRHQR